MEQRLSSTVELKLFNLAYMLNSRFNSEGSASIGGDDSDVEDLARAMSRMDTAPAASTIRRPKAEDDDIKKARTRGFKSGIGS